MLAGEHLDDAVLSLASRVPLVCAPTDGSHEVLSLMQKNGLSAVPVVDDEGVVVGIHVMKAIVGRLMDQP